MPIIPTFDPSTGASGGPAPTGSATLYNVPFEGPIDLTDGSWTLYDPDSLIQSISYASGWHTVVWNALAVGSADYNWSSGTDHRAPRWYKSAEIDGNQVTSDDLMQSVFYIQTDNTNRGDFDNAIVHGVCVDPTSTVATTIIACGLYANALAAGTNTALGVYTVNGSATTGVGTSDRCMTTFQYGARHSGSGAFTVLDNQGYRIQNGSRNSVNVLPSTTNLNWIVGLGTRANTTTIALNDESQRFKLYRVAVKADLAGVL
jgi:hypothetical protein